MIRNLRKRKHVREGVLISLLGFFITIAIFVFAFFPSKDSDSKSFCPSDLETKTYPTWPGMLIDSPILENSTPNDLLTTTAELIYLTELTGVSAYAWSPNSEILAIAVSGMVRLFDVERQEYISTLQDHSGKILYVRFSPNGQLVASLDELGLVKVRDIVTGEEFVFETDSWTPMAFSPDSSALALSMDVMSDSYPMSSHRLQVIDIRSGRVLNDLPPYRLDYPVTSLNFDPQGDYLVYGTWGHLDSHEFAHVVIWNLKLNERVFFWQGPPVSVSNVQFDSTGTLLLANFPGITYIWDCKGENLDAIEGSVLIRHNGKLLFHGKAEGNLILFDWTTGSRAVLLSDENLSLSYNETMSAFLQNTNLTILEIEY